VEVAAAGLHPITSGGSSARKSTVCATEYTRTSCYVEFPVRGKSGQRIRFQDECETLLAAPAGRDHLSIGDFSPVFDSGSRREMAFKVPEIDVGRVVGASR
jgi:hypothetical protein